MSTSKTQSKKIPSQPVPTQDPMQSEDTEAALGTEILFSPPTDQFGWDPSSPDMDVLTSADPAVFSEPAFQGGAEHPHVHGHGQKPAPGHNQGRGSEDIEVDEDEARRLEEWLYGEQRSGGLASVVGGEEGERVPGIHVMGSGDARGGRKGRR